MTQFTGGWDGGWNGVWEGGESSGPSFANMAMVATGSGSLVATLLAEGEQAAGVGSGNKRRRRREDLEALWEAGRQAREAPLPLEREIPERHPKPVPAPEVLAQPAPKVEPNHDEDAAQAFLAWLMAA